MSTPTRHSMTGFARAEGALGAWRWTWEAKSVNGRGLDLKVRLPSGFDTFEAIAREAVNARFKRGSIQLGLSLRREGVSGGASRLDHAFLDSVIQAGEAYVLRGLVQPARWDGLLALRGAFLAEDDPGADPRADAGFNDAVTATLEQALDALIQTRVREGAVLSAFLSARLDEIDALVCEARGLAACAPGALADKLKARLSALVGEVGFDPQRAAQEVAILAAKADVREELDRLDAHLADARAALGDAAAIGRRLDFLTQEFNREANTLCSKASDMALTRVGLALKTAIDQMREQAANVE